jgi:hypothetical protein
MSNVRVTLDGVLDWILDLLTTFNIQLVITLNYSTITDFNTSPITPARTKSFPACSVFTRCSLVMASNKGYSSASIAKSSLNDGSLTIAPKSSLRPAYISSAYRSLKVAVLGPVFGPPLYIHTYISSAWTITENTNSNSTSITALPRNGSTCYNM